MQGDSSDSGSDRSLKRELGEINREVNRAWGEMVSRWCSRPYIDMAKRLFESEEFGHYRGSRPAQNLVVGRLHEECEDMHNWILDARLRRGFLMTVYLVVKFVIPAGLALALVTWIVATAVTANGSLERKIGNVISGGQGAFEWFLGYFGGLAAALSVCTVVGLLIWFWRGIKRLLDQWSKIYDDAVREQVEPVMRSCLSEIANDEFSVPSFDITVAPGLASEVDSEKTVARSDFQRLTDLVVGLGASTVAVSGARGAGKSTLLKEVTGVDGDDLLGGQLTLRVAVRAPVSYDPREFVVHLFGCICDEFLGMARSASRRSSRLVGRFALGIVRKLLRLAAIAAMVSVWMPFSIPWAPDWRAYLDVHGRLAVALAVGGTFGLMVLYSSLRKLRISVPGKMFSRLVRRVEAQRERLRNIRVFTAEASGNLAFGGSSLGGKRLRQVSELPLTLPEITHAYRDLVQEIADTLRRFQVSPGIVIGIDEIDRISDPEDVDKFLNEVKAIFNIPGTVYIVTVSADAIAHFERRISDIRGAVDSTFDDVLRLDSFSLEESKEMLHRRLAGVPDFFVGLCHCLSGGVPRDLVRCARSLVTQRKRSGESDRDELAMLLVDHEIGRILDGFIHQVAALPPSEGRAALLECLSRSDWRSSEYRSDKLVQSLGVELSSSSDLRVEAEDGQVVNIRRSAAAAVVYYATVLRMFLAGPPEVSEIERITEVHRWLAVDPAVAIDRLNYHDGGTPPERRPGIAF